MMASTIQIMIAIVLCASAYLIGIYTDYSSAWPLPELKMLVRTRLNNASIQTDKFGRLLRYSGKTEVTCPPQDATTAVFLVLGQSNAANYQGQRYQSPDDRVINFSEGHCYIASSPCSGPMVVTAKHGHCSALNLFNPACIPKSFSYPPRSAVHPFTDGRLEATLIKCCSG